MISFKFILFLVGTATLLETQVQFTEGANLVASSNGNVKEISSQSESGTPASTSNQDNLSHDKTQATQAKREETVAEVAEQIESGNANEGQIYNYNNNYPYLPFTTNSYYYNPNAYFPSPSTFYYGAPQPFYNPYFSYYNNPSYYNLHIPYYNNFASPYTTSYLYPGLSSYSRPTYTGGYYSTYNFPNNGRTVHHGQGFGVSQSYGVGVSHGQGVSVSQGFGHGQDGQLRIQSFRQTSQGGLGGGFGHAQGSHISVNSAQSL